MTIDNNKKQLSFIFLEEEKQSKYVLCFYEPTMMLLMGIWISLTKKPINPIIAKPMAVAIAIFWNSNLEK